MQNDQGCYGIPKRQKYSEVLMNTPSGPGGSTYTAVRYFTVLAKQIGSDIQVISNSVFGTTLMAVTTGLYTITYTDGNGSGLTGPVITVNNLTPTSTVGGSDSSVVAVLGPPSGQNATVSVTLELKANDYVRCMWLASVANAPNVVGVYGQLRMVKHPTL